MSTPNGDRWLKRVWLVNGVVLLAAVVIGLGAAVVAGVSEWHGDKAVAVAAPSPEQGPNDGNAAGRAVRFDAPEPVRGSNTRLVLLHNGADYLPESAGIGSARKQYNFYSEGPIVNVVFLPTGIGPGHLLFDRPAYLRQVSYPGETDGRADSLQTWISYEVVLIDTNGDGKLDDDDERQLMVSDLDGNNLKPVLPAGWRLKDYSPLKDRRTLVITGFASPKVGEKFDERRALERAFLYDVRCGKLESFAALDSLVARAGRVLVKAPASARQ